MKNLVALAPVLGAILRPAVPLEISGPRTNIAAVNIKLRKKCHNIDPLHEWRLDLNNNT